MGRNRTSYFEAPPFVVHLVYNGEITLACRVKHLEPRLVCTPPVSEAKEF